MDENLPPTPEPRAVPATAQPRLELSADESSRLTRASFKTAIPRRKRSAPADASFPLFRRWLAFAPGSEQSGDLLDYGCGTGADVTYYRNQGLDAEGYDPHPPFGYADLPRRLGGVAGAGTPVDAGSSQAAAESVVVTLSHRRDDSLTTPLRNTAAFANGGRVETHEGLAALSSNGTITDEESQPRRHTS